MIPDNSQLTLPIRLKTQVTVLWHLDNDNFAVTKLDGTPILDVQVNVDLLRDLDYTITELLLELKRKPSIPHEEAP